MTRARQDALPEVRLIAQGADEHVGRPAHLQPGIQEPMPPLSTTVPIERMPPGRLPDDVLIRSPRARPVDPEEVRLDQPVAARGAGAAGRPEDLGGDAE